MPKINKQQKITVVPLSLNVTVTEIQTCIYANCDLQQIWTRKKLKRNIKKIAQKRNFQKNL